MKLRLYHGRNNPEQEMNDWGFEGAILDEVEGIIGLMECQESSLLMIVP